MRPARLLLKPKSERSKTIKVFANVRIVTQSYPKQLHLAYISLDESLEADKERILRTLVDKWPRTPKPKEIDWKDAEAKLDRLRHASRKRSEYPEDRGGASVGTQVIAPRGVGDFETIARMHSEYLKRMALHLTGRRDFADDLVQSTLMRAMTRFADFEQGTDARAWLATILLRLHLDTLKHYKVVSSSLPLIEAVGVDAPPIDVLSDQSKHAQIAAAIAQLDPDLQEVVNLSYEKDMRYRDIARMLNLPIGTVGTRMMRARQRLRELLGARDK